jgi:two-component system NtrC family sensor kinase
MRIKLQTRVFLTFVLTVALLGIVCAVLGAVFISRTVLNQAQRRVKLDLHGAWAAVNGELEQTHNLLAAFSITSYVQTARRQEDPELLRSKLETIRREGDLDFVGVTDRTGEVLVRGRAPYHTGDDISNDPLVRRGLRGESARGFTVLGRERLGREGHELERRAFFVFESTPKAKPRAKDRESSGMALAVAVPTRNENQDVTGVLYGGILLNRNVELVDRIRSQVFGEENTYEGHQLGTVTVFQWDVRVATNVQSNGERAIGTRVSSEVYDRVLENGQSWYDRAFVVNDWYISAYDPIHAFAPGQEQGKVIGILYVGVLAEQYDDIKHRLWLFYAALSVGATLVVILIGFMFSRRLTQSISRLAQGAHRIAAGNLDTCVSEPNRDDEILDLTRDFNAMARSLRQRDRELREANVELEETNRTLERLNRNYLDMLGFVSHELKNTLGNIYTAAHTLHQEMVGELSEVQKRLTGSICRSINSAVTMTRNYLDLSRIEQGELKVEPETIDFVSEVARPVIEEFQPQIDKEGVTLQDELPDSATVHADPDLLPVVYKNLLNNALKYGREHGTIRLGHSRTNGEHQFSVWNEGEGLSEEQIERLFHKFERLGDKQGRRTGTGLGLFVTKEIINKNNGRIWAESEEGEWVKFTFALPAENDQ